jgi:hypothetical protein
MAHFFDIAGKSRRGCMRKIDSFVINRLFTPSNKLNDLKVLKPAQ